MSQSSKFSANVALFWCNFLSLLQFFFSFLKWVSVRVFDHWGTMASPTRATESQCGGYHWNKAIADGALPNSLSTWKQSAMLRLPFHGWEASIQKRVEKGDKWMNAGSAWLFFFARQKNLSHPAKVFVVTAQRKVILESSPCECISQDRCNQNSSKEGSGQNFFHVSLR